MSETPNLIQQAIARIDPKDLSLMDLNCNKILPKETERVLDPVILKLKPLAYDGPLVDGRVPHYRHQLEEGVLAWWNIRYQRRQIFDWIGPQFLDQLPTLKDAEHYQLHLIESSNERHNVPLDDLELFLFGKKRSTASIKLRRDILNMALLRVAGIHPSDIEECKDFQDSYERDIRHVRSLSGGFLNISLTQTEELHHELHPFAFATYKTLVVRANARTLWAQKHVNPNHLFRYSVDPKLVGPFGGLVSFKTTADHDVAKSAWRPLSTWITYGVQAPQDLFGDVHALTTSYMFPEIYRHCVLMREQAFVYQ